MAFLNPYLTLGGNCEEAFNFYKAAFGGEFAMIMRYKDAPPDSRPPGADTKEDEKIMHISYPIGNKGTILMGSDRPAYMGVETKGDNLSISITADSEKEADDLYAKLSAGGKITMPLAKTFWGSYFAMFTDKFGIHWMISYDYGKAG